MGLIFLSIQNKQRAYGWLFLVTIQKKWEAVTDVGQLPPIFKSYLSIFNFYFSASPLAVVGQ